MAEYSKLVVFRIDEQRYAFSLSAVVRIVRAVEVTPLPNAPSVALGAIDVAGRVLPVLSIRKRLGLPGRELTPADQLMIARTARREVVIVVDETLDVMAVPLGGMVPATEILPMLRLVEGVVQLADGLVLIEDLEKFLSLEEERLLDEALSNAEENAG